MTTSNDATVTVLDHIENITVPGNVFEKPKNEYWALTCLRDGMESLYLKALRCDQVVQQRVNPTGNNIISCSGNSPKLAQVRLTLLTCAFHWYAISACQYVRTVGAVAYQHDSERRDYTEKVIPEVLAFRNKVAAHFAWSMENNRDNDAERLASIFPPLSFETDSFYVGAFTVAVGRGGSTSTSEVIKPWSLCRTHETLRKRYWPDRQVEPPPIT